ncbi:Multicopper oxidase mco [Paenibacillus allorhizoplanae]|uniref:Multicopper oxidase mco n=1 Tax=Paenibacillus allorhizoplanae TaxID=2905648 RepID=A0ABN8G054_9BACL|nr:copper oxidase [Paenibacillus allorhizoplanae]CAH1195929.1 Multicopper oxidase mco [Paenibacillus allorhizoplanae]
MVVSPNLRDLSFVNLQGVKFFELIAEPVEQEILPGVFFNGWGYNGSIPGPTIRVFPGDWVTIRVHNRLPEATSVHWHGLDVPNRMDGVPAVEPSPYIEQGQFFDYHFQIVNPPGTHMYHTHVDAAFQELMGLGGGFIIEDPYECSAQSDYFIMLQEFHLKGMEKGVVKTGQFELDTMSDGFNFFTMNGRCFPHTTPLPVRFGDEVRIRFGNIGMNAHPIHLHGHQFWVAAADGNTIPHFNRELRNTILVPSGVTTDIEFSAQNYGVWPLHCHMPHHTSNNMTKPTGGMFTVVQYV